MNNSKVKSKSAMQQMGTLILRQIYTLKTNIKKLLMISLLPVATAIIVCLVASEKMFESYEDTKSTLFAMVCVAIWIGLFNSIQEICQERGILKREYMANLKLSAYIGSKFFVQTVLCLLQTGIFLGICCISIEFPEDGLCFGYGLVDIFITLFLIMLASDTLGLLISSIVKSGDIANIIAPIILILQLVMSGVLFKLEGFTEKLSYITFSKWGMEGLGSIADLNSLELNTILGTEDEQTKQTLIQILDRQTEEIFEASSEHLLKVWIILLVFSAVLIILSSIILKRISKDSR